jgi:SNF2-related domain
MDNIFKRVLGIVFAVEEGEKIVIRGVKAEAVGKEIMREWSTSRVERNMFIDFKSSMISFPKFFAPDVHYMLQTLAANKETRNRSALRKAARELEENTWLKRITEEVKPFLDRSKLNLFDKTPLPHQSKFFDIYEDRVQRYGLTGYLLSAAPGSGKTMMGLYLAEMCHASAVIMVVPKNAVHKVWQRTLQEEYKKPQQAWVASDGLPYKRQKYIIVHYEGLEKAMAAIKSANLSNPVVILDESHNLNESESLRTQLFVQMCKQIAAKHVLWSSGTPLKALGYEAIPLLRTIDPLFTPDAEQRFKKIFGREAKRALDILRNRIGFISFRVEKGEFVDNKAKTHILKVSMPGSQAYTLATVRKEMQAFVEQRLKHYKSNFRDYEKIYDRALDIHEDTLKTPEQKNAFKIYEKYIKQIRKGFDAGTMAEMSRYCNNYELKEIIPSLPQEMRETFKSARSVIKYVELKVMGEALGTVLGKKRAQCHVEMIPYIEPEKIVEQADKKTLVFTSFVAVVTALQSYFTKKGFFPIAVYGETNKDLAAHVTKFDNDPKANPLNATYKSLSTAVPLISANTVIFTNLPFREYELTQAEARVDRLGQDTPVHFYRCQLDTGDEPNISTRAGDILEWSKEQVAAIMGTEYKPIDEQALNVRFVGMEDYPVQITDDSIEAAYFKELRIENFCIESIEASDDEAHSLCLESFDHAV